MARLCSARVSPLGRVTCPPRHANIGQRSQRHGSFPCEKPRGEASTAAPGDATRQYKDAGTHVKSQVVTLRDLKHIVVGGYALPCYHPGDAEQGIYRTSRGFRAYVIATETRNSPRPDRDLSEGGCTIRGCRDRNPAIGHKLTIFKTEFILSDCFPEIRQ